MEKRERNYITDKVIKKIKKKNLVCLRDKKTGKLLNVSYSKVGLMFTANKSGKYIYFKKVNRAQDISENKQMSDKVYVEKFIPKNHKNKHLQMCEITWLNKAWYL